jgi:hypothetical protein
LEHEEQVKSNVHGPEGRPLVPAPDAPLPLGAVVVPALQQHGQARERGDQVSDQQQDGQDGSAADDPALPSPSVPPCDILEGVLKIAPQEALDKADRLFEIIRTELAKGVKDLP